MNPLSLLTKGRTIRGLKERPGPYKLLTKSALPNFSGAKSPVPTTSHQEVAQQALFEPKTETVVTEPKPAPAVAPNKETPAKEMAAKAEGSESLAERLANWLRQRAPWRGQRPARKPAVQTELALDKVKVIRNDLTQDDVEIIAIDKNVEKKAGKPLRRKEPEQTSANP